MFGALTKNYDVMSANGGGIEWGLVQGGVSVVFMSKFGVWEWGCEVVVVEISKFWTKIGVFSYHSESGRVWWVKRQIECVIGLSACGGVREGVVWGCLGVGG